MNLKKFIMSTTPTEVSKVKELKKISVVLWINLYVFNNWM